MSSNSKKMSQQAGAMCDRKTHKTKQPIISPPPHSHTGTQVFTLFTRQGQEKIGTSGQIIIYKIKRKQQKNNNSVNKDIADANRISLSRK
jgi:hypothetical protein